MKGTFHTLSVLFDIIFMQLSQSKPHTHDVTVIDVAFNIYFIFRFVKICIIVVHN